MFPRDGLPVAEPVEIRWNDHLVPWITARCDRDCAVALGAVHAHLRLTQLEVLRKVAWGRVAEMAGPAAIDVDRALRTLGVARAVPGILAMQPPETRAWLEGFVDGINHVVDTAPEDPPDFAMLGLSRERWTAADVMAVGRAAVADVNWLIWLRLVPLRREPGWPGLWEKLLANGTGSIANLAGFDLETMLAGALGGALKGSNAWAVHADHSATGSALLAGDPHLPISVPNIWLCAGYRSPSHHCVGFQLPGLPFTAFGRNRDLAWGGTAPHTASSDLFDLSDLRYEPFDSRSETIRVRGGGAETVAIRTSRYGPIISDAVPMGATYALRWVGHEPSDELSSMLALNRAKNFQDFREAADGMAVPGQNWVVAERTGGIAKQIAAKLPRRPHAPLADLISKPEAARHWERFVTAKDFPPERDPARGFVVSANDRPEDGPAPLAHFYSPVDRAERIAAVLARARPVTLDDMVALQRDVTVPGALALRDRLLVLAKAAGERGEGRGGPSQDEVLSARGEVVPLLVDWDGSYPESSRGALAFELLVAHVSAHYHSKAERAFYGALFTARTLIAQDLHEPRTALVSALAKALVATAKELRRYETWGDVHRLRLAHVLAGLPLVGRRLVFADMPVGGTSDAVMKTAHPAVPRPHRAFYGSIARFVCDLGAEDGATGVLLGGQDGWLGSTAMLDQLPLWRAGRAMPLPLSEAGVARDFPHLTAIPPCSTPPRS
ncbi:penicillin acylase family protein [Salinarimonas chemoclinalis]|uniref:penicillin acylase family protein n=1 Tax=Salinarimonas chemoclinalis TaxID=3241599 RepID=UPI0035560EE6